MTYAPEVRASLERLLIASLSRADGPGIHSTPVPYLVVSRKETPSQTTTAGVDPSLCLILQGRKVIRWKGRTIECGPGQFLTSTFELPAIVSVEDASPERPYVSLVISLEMAEISQVIAETGITPPRPESSRPEMFLGEPFPDFLPMVERLVSLGPSPQDQYWAKLLKKNLIYSLLTSPVGYLFAPRKKTVIAARIPNVVDWMRTHFKETFHLESLAAAHAMSLSSLHHQFRDATGITPVQFQRLLRLQEARRLLVAGDHDVTQAALAVGYASLSHFGRDYTRLFGLPPGKDSRALRLSAKVINGTEESG